MIQFLKELELNFLIGLLEKPEIWNSLDVDYHPPRVERIWCQHGDYRIYLHFIHACKSGEALYHSHPWPSVMHVIDGTYEMGLGFKEEEQIKTISTIEVDKGMYYEMLDPDGYHYVRPIHGVAKTIMVTGKPWITKEAFKSSKQLERLHDVRKEEIREWFLRYYLRQNYL